MKNTPPPNHQKENRDSKRKDAEQKVHQRDSSQQEDQVKKTDNLKRTVTRTGNRNDRNFLIL